MGASSSKSRPVPRRTFQLSVVPTAEKKKRPASPTDAPPPYPWSDLSAKSLKSSPSKSSLGTQSSTTLHSDRGRSYQKQEWEYNLDILKQYDTVILMDDSSSMQGLLWKEAGKALMDLAEVVVGYDADGIDIHFLNSDQSATGVRSVEEVQALFTKVGPTGLTPIAEKLEMLLRDYIRKLESPPNMAKVKRVNFLVITDGEPTDEPQDVIQKYATMLDKMDAPLAQVGIQFVQIGNCKRATAYLQGLDIMHPGMRDIVDTTPHDGRKLTAEKLIKILVGAINRRIDRKDERNPVGKSAEIH